MDLDGFAEWRGSHASHEFPLFHTHKEHHQEPGLGFPRYLHSSSFLQLFYIFSDSLVWLRGMAGCSGLRGRWDTHIAQTWVKWMAECVFLPLSLVASPTGDEWVHIPCGNPYSITHVACIQEISNTWLILIWYWNGNDNDILFSFCFISIFI